jgi:hypothetical protein
MVVHLFGRDAPWNVLNELDGDSMTYKIVRFHRDNPEKNGETIEEGLTLKEAQAHCSRKDTAGEGWFDGYREEDE